MVVHHLASALKEAAAAGQQQIIVIPQSLLQQTTSKNNRVQLRLAPVKKEPITNMTTVNASEILGQYVPKPPQKRIMAPASPSHSMSSGYDSSSEDKNDAGQPVRKRANLDHLSPEEKLMRRKLKNRVAAQNARDKKRLRMEEMEKLIQMLQEDKRHLRMENEKLLAMNRSLASENEKLRSVKDEPSPLTPESLSSPLSPLTAGATTTAQGIVVPRPTSEPAALPLLQRGSGRGMAVERSLAAALLLWACLMVPASRRPSPQKKISPLRISQMSRILQRNRLPLKKRNWLEQRSWTPAKT